MKEKRQTYNLLVSVLLLLGIVLFPRTGRPQVGTIPLAGPVDVQAGRLEILKEEGIVQATGGIVLSWGERRVSADSALYRFREGIIEARGNVSYSDGEVEFSAESVLVDVKTGLVSLKKAVLRVRKEHIFVQAEEFVEEEKDLFRVKKARFTTCDECEERDWEIGIGRGKVELGGYATGSNITLLVRGKTLFWVPYAFFPAKTKRETGFLVPSFSSDSTRGVRFIVPFYVVTSSSSDVTLNFDYMTERGFKPAAEVRFRLTQDSEGKIQGEYIKDRKVGEERFALTGGTVITGDFPFFMNWKSRYASDETYFVDFRDEIFLRTARQSISDGAFGLEGDSLASYAGFTYVQNLDPAGDSKTTKNVLPTIDFRVKRFPFLKIFSVFGDVRFKNFYSALEGAVEKGDARFRFVTPIKFFDRFLFDMDTEVYGGAYRTKNPGGGKEIEEIAYVDSVLTLSTLLSRRYGRTIHQVRPSFSFQKTDRLTNPPSVEFEPTDRAPEKMRLLGGLDMRFIRLGEGELRELGSFSLRYSYDVQREEKIQATLLDPFSP
ncbi:MAG: LPS-assembly protein LptD, partial [Deltaproteobacteria bacterium]